MSRLSTRSRYGLPSRDRPPELLRPLEVSGGIGGESLTQWRPLESVILNASPQGAVRPVALCACFISETVHRSPIHYAGGISKVVSTNVCARGGGKSELGSRRGAILMDKAWAGFDDRLRAAIRALRQARGSFPESRRNHRGIASRRSTVAGRPPLDTACRQPAPLECRRSRLNRMCPKSDNRSRPHDRAVARNAILAI